MISFIELVNKHYEATHDLDFYFLMAALDIEKMAINADHIKVGCVIVRDKKIISSGYNDIGIHAEQSAIEACISKNINIRDTTIYSTLQPCPICSELIIKSKIKKVVYSFRYPRSLCNNVDLDELFRKNNIESFLILPSTCFVIKSKMS